jgi:hypothetical protein
MGISPEGPEPRESGIFTGFARLWVLAELSGPWRNRTSNLGIKSPLLCQLS